MSLCVLVFVYQALLNLV